MRQRLGSGPTSAARRPCSDSSGYYTKVLCHRPASMGHARPRCPVRCWHKCEGQTASCNVRVQGAKRKHKLALSSSQFGPAETLTAPNGNRSRCWFLPYQSTRFSREDAVSLSLRSDMLRREFNTLVGGAAAAWPFAAQGQVPNKRPLITHWSLDGEQNKTAAFSCSGSSYAQTSRNRRWRNRCRPGSQESNVDDSDRFRDARRRRASGVGGELFPPGMQCDMPYIAGLPSKQIELAREVVRRAGKIGLLANVINPKVMP